MLFRIFFNYICSMNQHYTQWLKIAYLEQKLSHLFYIIVYSIKNTLTGNLNWITCTPVNSYNYSIAAKVLIYTIICRLQVFVIKWPPSVCGKINYTHTEWNAWTLIRFLLHSVSIIYYFLRYFYSVAIAIIIVAIYLTCNTKLLTTLLVYYLIWWLCLTLLEIENANAEWNKYILKLLKIVYKKIPYFHVQWIMGKKLFFFLDIYLMPFST